MIGLALGDQHSMILKHDGSVWSTAPSGYSSSRRARKIFFVRVIPSGAMAVAAGTSYSFVLKQDGHLWGKGVNSSGQLGDGTRNSRDRFFFVRAIEGAKAVAAGVFHSMVLTGDGCVLVT